MAVRAEPSLLSLPFTEAELARTIPARLADVVRRFPDAPALTGSGRRWTYRELWARVSQIAVSIEENARPGSGCVAFLVEHSPEMVIAAVSVLRAGRTYLAIHPGAPAERQAAIVRDILPEMILTSKALHPRALELAGTFCPVLVLDEIAENPAAEGPPIEATAQHPSTLFYTSGSTGRPKGVLKSHAAVLHRVLLAVRHDGFSASDRISLLTHCSFSASEADTFGALLNGATLCVFDFANEGLAAFRDWLDAEQVTVLHPPVLLFRRFLATLAGEQLFPHVRLVALAGDKVLPADIDAWRRHFSDGCALTHRFSTTETGLLAVARIERVRADGAPVLAGLPVEGKQLALVDEAGQVVPAGTVGELVVRSRFIADGYWGQPFLSDPDTPGQRVYATGDTGRFLPDGRFEFLGRRDRQVKIRGFRVELGEIEAALAQHPEVREAAVIERDRTPNDKQLVGYVVPRSSTAPTAEALRAFLQQKLPPYMVPAGFLSLDTLPLTPTGKLDRQALPPLDGHRHLTAEYAAPASNLERQLAAIWASVLTVDRVGIRDNFFDLGGHSLLAAQMFARVEELLGIRLPLATLFRAPTIERLAAAIGEGKTSAGWRSLVAINSAGTRPPIFGIPGVGGNVLGYRDLSQLLGPDQPFYALQSRGLSGAEPPLTSLPDIAQAYLAEIRAVQPQGPYQLVGVCMGAVVAYDIAQRLVAAGQKVATLVLLEPRPPATGPRGEVRPALKARTALRFVGRRLRVYAQTLARLRGRTRLEYLRDRLGVLRQMVTHRDVFRGHPEDFHLEVVRQANLTAVHAYTPKPYPGHVVLFLAEGRKIDADDDPRLHWKRLALGGLDVHFTPGADSGLTLVRPHVESLAPMLQGYLDRTRAPLPAPTEPAETVADGFLEELNAQGVEYIFVNPGSDIAPIQEAIAKSAARSRPAPELILCQHESVALAAAHGHFMVTGRPQVVLVHADVGTLNLGANLHNAQRGRAGVVICAGSAPRTVAGRTRHMDWLQAQLNQAGSVDGYVKWHHELAGRDDLHAAVQQAFQTAAAAPAGPVYLTLPKDVLLEPLEPKPAEPVRTSEFGVQTADRTSLAQAAQWLAEAKHPLLLTAYAGRNPKAVAAMVRLAEVLAMPVVESRQRVSFPSSHPLHLGYSPFPYVEQADCILVVDHDVPWVPAQGQPSPDCRIIHLDVDPLKRNIPVWGFPVDLSIEADSAVALDALAEEVERRIGPDRARLDARRQTLEAEHHSQRTGWRQRAAEVAGRSPIASEWVTQCLQDQLAGDALVIGEAVSNSPALWHHLERDTPGSYFQSVGSGLGWGLGAALGARLASPEKTVVCVVGDGSWVFGQPIAAYWAAERYRAPFLTVLLNNQGYAATAEAIRGVAPDGIARRTNQYPACDLPTSPQQYAKLAEAMGLWARTVEDPGTLSAALREALAEVRGGRSALLDVRIASSRPYEELPDE